jgi:ribonuclease HII
MALKNSYSKDPLEAGCDEAGRGCLAGPVVAAAVILPASFRSKILNDSKKMTEIERFELEPEIKEKALAWAIGVVDNETIDKINILNASFLAMHRAIEQLTTVPGFLLIDGNRFNPYPGIRHACIIKGDGKFKAIAAASVLAKVHRDRLMQEYHVHYPAYKWDQNKGYPTVAHREALALHGETPMHRKSFTLLPEDFQLELEF